jgi:uncharacterized protein (TIGR00375 family)
LATSKQAVPEYLEYWAKLKGVDVLATGDCIHPKWLDELKEKLTPNENGFLSLKPEFKLNKLNPQIFLPKKLDNPIDFILTTEISNIYKKNGKTRKVHNLCVLPSFESAEKFQKRLEKIGNIKSDGRPILGLDSKILLELLLETDDKAYLIPAHIWTPWFSVLGSNSGFDSIEECFEDLTKYIFALETGLSSDPPMNWSCSFLDDFRLVSNSDAHSPEKIGREANIFDCEKSYDNVYKALKYDDGFVGTIEFFPQEGKYHFDGHRKCNICFDPLETITHKGICPVCNKPLVRGVSYRVAELSDRSNINDLKNLKNKKKFYSITSLPDVISEITGKSPKSLVSSKEYFKTLEKIGSDFNTLLFADLKKIEKHNFVLAEAIKRLRSGHVKIQNGYDGEFGRITVFETDEIHDLKNAKLFPSEDEPQPENNHNNRKSTKNKKFDVRKFKKELFENRENFTNNTSLTKYIDLTESQKIAVDQKLGPCMVIAGPGTGKTRVLVERIAMLVRCGIDETNILAITFSNKASDEIKDRLSQKIIAFSIAENILTFHKLGLKILSENLALTGRIKDFFIIDDDDKEELLSKILDDKRLVKKYIKNISLFKQGLEIFDTFDTNAPNISEILKKYDTELQKMNAFDLDDLIYLAVHILSTNDKVRDKYKKQYKYILIDEYQDINSKQYDLIKLLLPKNNPNLFVIGDPDQSIYGFRGSDRRFITKIQEDYPSIKKIKLKKSYRCPDTVLKLAGQALHKTEFLEGLESGIKTEILECDTDEREAFFIASKIDEMMGGTKGLSLQKHTQYQDIHSFSDFAILCRTTKIFDAIVKKLQSHSIPFQVIGQKPFYKLSPIKELIKKLKNIYFKTEDDFEISTMILASKNLRAIFESMLDFTKLEEHKNENLRDIIKKFLNFVEIYGYDYSKFFQDISLNTSVDDFDIKQEAVSVMTIHSAKGLEFQTVFVPACEDGIIPFEIFGKKTKEEIEEEERLFFVAITRTKKYLFLSHCQKRFFETRLLKLEKSEILNRFESSLLKQSKITTRAGINQIEFSF